MADTAQSAADHRGYVEFSDNCFQLYIRMLFHVTAPFRGAKVFCQASVTTISFL